MKNIGSEVKGILLSFLVIIALGGLWYNYVIKPIKRAKSEILTKYKDEVNLIVGAEKYYKVINGLMSDTMSIETKIRIANILFQEGKDIAENLDSTEIEIIENDIKNYLNQFNSQE